jgi:hypothetical protein
MPMLAATIHGVIGVDPHRDTLTAAAVSPTGAVLTHTQASADPTGYQAVLAFALEQIPGRPDRRCWAIEGIGSFGAGLAAFLTGHGERVVEVAGPRRPARRSSGKTDAIDAVRAAQDALAIDQLATARRRGDREALRVLLACRRGATGARVAAISQLKALIVSAPDPLRAQVRSLTAKLQIRACAALPDDPAQPPEQRMTALALRATAQRIQALVAEARLCWSARSAGWSKGWRPGCWSCPASGPSAPPSCWSAGRIPAAAAPKPPSPPWPGSAPSPPPPGWSPVTGSTAGATGSSTGPCTSLPWSGCATTPRPRPTRLAVAPRARAHETSNAA